MTTPPYWQSAINYLASKDRVIASLIATYPNEVMLGIFGEVLTLSLFRITPNYFEISFLLSTLYQKFSSTLSISQF